MIIFFIRHELQVNEWCNGSGETLNNIIPLCTGTTISFSNALQLENFFEMWTWIVFGEQSTEHHHFSWTMVRLGTAKGVGASESWRIVTWNNGPEWKNATPILRNEDATSGCSVAQIALWSTAHIMFAPMNKCCAFMLSNVVRSNLFLLFSENMYYENVGELHFRFERISRYGLLLRTIRTDAFRWNMEKKSHFWAEWSCAPRISDFITPENRRRAH